MMQEQLVTPHATAAVAAAVAHGGDGWMGFLLVACANTHFAQSSREIEGFQQLNAAALFASTSRKSPWRASPWAPLLVPFV